MSHTHVVTAVSLREGGTEIAETRTIGFFDDELSAVAAVSDNEGWLQQELVVIEQVPPGLYKDAEATQWFKLEVVMDYFFYYSPTQAPALTNLKLPLWRNAYETCPNSGRG